MPNYREVEILLVEDNPNDAELAIRSLKKHNMANHLHWVKDGVEALDFIFARGGYAGQEARSPKVILLDLKLPKKDGLEVLSEIKSNPETKIIPIVMLTSSKEEQDMIGSYKLGVNSYVVKPVDFDNFVKAVSDLGLYWLLINKPLSSVA